MPRDLDAERGANAVQLQKSPEELSSNRSIVHSPSFSASPSTTGEQQQPNKAGTQQRNLDIKPYVQSLTMLDLESCVKLEEATFPPQERGTKEKFIYRLTKCGELSIGLFTSAETAGANFDSTDHPPHDPAIATTASTSQPVYSGTPNRKQVLLAHIIATKTKHETVTDDDMALPDNWSTLTSQPSTGHQEAGRTVCIHSLAVLPAFQGQGLGKLLLKSYIQRIESSGLADRIALIAHDHLISFYQGMGFENKGPSKAQFGGGGWTDMVLQLKNVE